MTAKATGKKLLLLNTLVGGVAGSAASFCNTLAMRSAEINKGIDIFSDEKLTKKLGISKIAAKNAVIETSISRAIMSASSVFIPTIFILSLNGIGVNPTAPAAVRAMDLTCIAAALRLGLPMSVAVFPPICCKPGKEVESEFHTQDKIYYSKGL